MFEAWISVGFNMWILLEAQPLFTIHMLVPGYYLRRSWCLQLFC
jgi:hypothetical protein